jgi:uncharacterized protein YicC (UPF0701 family)
MATLPRNRLMELRQQRQEPASQEDVLTAAVEIKKLLTKVLDSRISQLESGVAAGSDGIKSYVDRLSHELHTVVGSIEGRLGKRLDEVASKCTKQISEVEKVYDSYNQKLSSVEIDLGLQMGKLLEGKLDKALRDSLTTTIDAHVSSRLADIKDSHAKHLQTLEDIYNKQLSIVEDRHKQEVSFIQRVCEENLQQIRNLLDKLQLPTPQVQINVPEQQAPTVNVSVPEQKTPIVNIPELRQPEVVVNIPQPRLVKKHIEYDAYNRPMTIEEQEI